MKKFPFVVLETLQYAMFSAVLRPLQRLLFSARTAAVRLVHLLPSMASGRLDTEHFRALLTPDLLRLESLFRSQGYGFRLVGGVVRDLLLGLPPKDVDIATECTPDDMIKLFEAHGMRYIPTGLEHGTITVHINSTDYEITTLRVDRVTDGRHAVVDFTTDWKTDALRRDLTINAMSLELDGTLYDYFQGQKHLVEKRIVFVGDARTRIEEDYLRILRYFRFYGRIVPEEDQHDPATLAVIHETAGGLRSVSVERVWLEVRKILTGNLAPHLIALIYELGVAESIGLPAGGNTVELKRVWTTMQGHGHSLQPVSLLMSLVHSVQEAYDLAHTWKLSNSEKRLGVFVVQHRDIAHAPDTPIKFYQDLLVDGAPLDSTLELLYYCGRVSMAKEIEEWRVPKLPVTGKDLKLAGFSAGPGMGRLLRQLHVRWKESYFTLGKEELMAVAQKTQGRPEPVS